MGDSNRIDRFKMGEPGYPTWLNTIPDPPKELYVKGAIVLEDRMAVAMVGTRRASPYGLATARRLAYDLARLGITVVSGLAEGIDRAAHEGALEAGGRTIAVLGHGLHTIYPPHHRDLADRIAQSGALVSEFPTGTEPKPWHFPRRNRLISGLSLGVVVVEAPPKSGALITARLAMEQGREVFAVPGPAGSLQSRGTHALLKDGARLVEDVQDILEELALPLRDSLKKIQRDQPEESPPDSGGLTDEEQRVLAHIPKGSWIDLETLLTQTALQPAQLLPILTQLELQGWIHNTPARGYSRK
jgi:DNA processing protein